MSPCVISLRSRLGSNCLGRFIGLTSTALIALIGSVFFAANASARDDEGGGVVYVGTNEGGVSGRNAIRAYYRNEHGKLKEIKGSPFYTGGTGVHPTANLTFANLGPFDADQCMIFDRDRNRLFTTNSGSDTIAVFDVLRDGRLAHVKGSPFHSHGINPVSVGLAMRHDEDIPFAKRNILVVANKDYDLGRPGFNGTTRQGSYATFRVTPRGQLIYIPGSSIPAGPVGGPNGGIGPGNATPTQALISPDAGVVFDANFFGLHVRSFVLGDDGRLEPAESQPIMPPVVSPPIPLGLQAHPKRPILYVGFVLASAIGVYTYNDDGDFRFAGVVQNVGNGPCWLLSNAEGTRLYASNNFDNTIAVFDTTKPLNPTKIQTAMLAQGTSGPNLGNASPFQMAMDSKGRFLHVVTQAATAAQNPAIANGLNVLKIDRDGKLTLTDFVAFPSTDGSRPQGVVAK